MFYQYHVGQATNMGGNFRIKLVRRLTWPEFLTFAIQVEVVVASLTNNLSMPLCCCRCCVADQQLNLFKQLCFINIMLVRRPTWAATS